MFKILIIDDDPTLRVALKRTLQTQGYEVTIAANGTEGIAQAQLVHPAVIICDWLMPDLDGLEVCRQIKADPQLETTFFILLTAREASPGEEDSLITGLNKGADDFLAKPISNKIEELKARVKAGLRLHLLNQKLQTLNQDLQTQKQALEAELAEAGRYVRSLLPAPLSGTVTTEALFVPSAQLGGDCFDYYWLNNDNFVIYLLDVSGHGVGSALLSVSILNVLRSQSLPNTDFCQPNQVLKALNHAFQMIHQGDKYFTIWYGVYNCCQHRLVYATAGHPPAVLLSSRDSSTKQAIPARRLGEASLPIGVLSDEDFDESDCYLEPGSTLYIFSDGAYEITQPYGTLWGIDAFVDLLTNLSKTKTFPLEKVLHEIQTLTDNDTFEDDLSVLKVSFADIMSG